MGSIEYIPKSWAAQLALQKKQEDINAINKVDTNATMTPQNSPTWQPQVNEMQTTTPEQNTARWSADITPDLVPEAFTAAVTQPVVSTGAVVPNTGTPADTNKYDEWWEKPAELGEKVMSGVGETIAKIPVLPKVLSFLEPALTWVSENIEKPFAAIITSPWSNSLPWRKGENWIQHEKREYEAWDAPTYVKGVAEFAMPLYWLPYVGWLGKGAMALRAGSKFAKAASKVLEVGARAANMGLPIKELKGATAAEQALKKSVEKIEFVPNEVLNQMDRPNVYKKTAQAVENVPVLKNVAQFFGGTDIFVRQNPQTPLQFAKRAIRNSKVVESQSDGLIGYLMPKLQVQGDFNKLLQVGQDGLVGAAKPKAEGASRYFYDVIERPSDYTFATKEAEKAVKTAHEILGQVEEAAIKEGVKRGKTDALFHRRVIGWMKDGKLVKSPDGSTQGLGRVYKTMEEGVKAGVVYDNNIYRSLADTIRFRTNAVARKRLTSDLQTLGKTAKDMWAEHNPELAEKFANNNELLTALDKKIQPAISRALRGESLPGATREMVRRNLPPEVATKMDDAFIMTPEVSSVIIKALSRDLRKDTKLTSKEFIRSLAELKREEGTLLREQPLQSSRISVHDLAEVITSKVQEKAAVSQLIEKTYQNYYKTMTAAKKDLLKSMIDDIKGLRSTAKSELLPIEQERNAFLRHYQGKVNSRELLAKFSGVPEFGDKLFPNDVVKTVEKVMNDRGNSWLNNMSTLSGMSRMLTATLDLSAPFIQGLTVAATNPKAWAKGVGKMIEFTFKPSNYQKFQTSEWARRMAGERFTAGSMPSKFEMVEALEPLQNIVSKVPKVGEKLKGAVQQTYGRAEAAFSGFGEATRNYVWDANTMKFRDAAGKLTMTTEAQRDLARTIDRMTGQMSTTALGIGTTQQQIESAFLFFSPRYTRAGLALMGDLLRGGVSGAMAREIVGKMMLGGMTYYTGICKSLGQEPNLDPSSGNFMTIKIGEQHVGVGGIYVAMMRLAYDAGVTAIQNPAELISTSRVDNPFFKFIYGRTSPLTGTLYSLAVEHKNYLGQPFESPMDYANFAFDKITPISLQSAGDVIAKEGVSPTAGLTLAAQFGGARMFPKSAWELRDEARNSYTQNKFGVPYEQANRMQKYEADQQQEVQTLKAEADKITVMKGEALSVGFINRSEEMEAAWQQYTDELKTWQTAYELGQITPYDFKEYMQEAQYGYGMLMEHINNKPEYADVMAKLNEPKTEVKAQYLGDACYMEMVQANDDNKFEVNGVFNYQAYNEFMDNLKNKYGDEAFQYAIDFKNRRDEELPVLAQEYKKAKEVLKPYWSVAEWAAKNYGERWAISPAGLRFISKMRKSMRLTNPLVAKYYNMFYDQNA